MKESRLMFSLSILLVVSHFITIILIVLFRMLNWFGDEELKTSLPIVSPLFASYTTLVVKYVIDNRNEVNESSKKLNKLFVLFSFALPTVLVFFIFGILLNQIIYPVTIENFSVFLGIAESVFGIFTGYIIKSLYDNKNQSTVAN